MINFVTRVVRQVKFTAHRIVTDRTFDRQYAANTRGIIPRWLLGLHRESSGYQATDPQEFNAMLRESHISPPQLTFLDLGCGKGRALILAHAAGFRRVIGVELSEKLASIAKRNCPYAEIAVQNASDFFFPEEDVLVYMFNPFGDSIVRTVAERALAHQHSCYVAYTNPVHREYFEGSEFVRLSPRGFIPLWRANKNPATQNG